MYEGICCLGSASPSIGKVNNFSQKCRSTAPMANSDSSSKAAEMYRIKERVSITTALQVDAKAQ